MLLDKLAEKYAQLKKTTVLDHLIKLDGTIVFILESGPKLTMTEQQLLQAIAELEAAEARSEPSKPFEYIEEAVKAEQPKKKSKSKTKGDT